MAKKRPARKQPPDKETFQETFQPMPDPSAIMGIFGGAMKDQIEANVARQSRYKGISAMIQDLPEDGQWTEKERARWVAALAALLDYSVEIVAEPKE